MDEFFIKSSAAGLYKSSKFYCVEDLKLRAMIDNILLRIESKIYSMLFSYDVNQDYEDQFDAVRIEKHSPFELQNIHLGLNFSNTFINNNEIFRVDRKKVRRTIGTQTTIEKKMVSVGTQTDGDDNKHSTLMKLVLLDMQIRNANEN